MRRDEIIAKLKEAEPKLRDFGVAALYLFGSYARDEGRADSDLDVFVDPVSDTAFDFLQYMDAYETIRKSVGEEIDVGYSTRDGLSPYIRANVEHEAIRIF
jgi:predicted nucleotidyltransferase